LESYASELSSMRTEWIFLIWFISIVRGTSNCRKHHDLRKTPLKIPKTPLELAKTPLNQKITPINRLIWCFYTFSVVI
jgi:hypothetical protein